MWGSSLDSYIRSKAANWEWRYDTQIDALNYWLRNITNHTRDNLRRLQDRQSSSRWCDRGTYEHTEVWHSGATASTDCLLNCSHMYIIHSNKISTATIMMTSLFLQHKIIYPRRHSQEFKWICRLVQMVKVVSGSLFKLLSNSLTSTQMTRTCDGLWWK